MSLTKAARLTTRLVNSETSHALQIAAQALKQGQLVAFPTDTIYGVGCGAFEAAAIERLYDIKGRARNKPIPILVKDLQQLSEIACDLSDTAQRLIERFWPGPLTLIVKGKSNSVGLTNGTIAVRMPGHVFALALIAEVGTPIATTSANRSGYTSPLDAHQVLLNLGSRIDLILDAGPCPGGIDSTVVDTTGPEIRILRETAISARLIKEALK